MASETSGTVKPGSMAKFETEAGLRTVAHNVRTHMRPRHAVELDKRVEYFKGEKLLKYLQENKVKGMPAIASEAEALHVAKALLRHEYFHRSEKTDAKGFLEVSRDQTFIATGYYTWIYQGSQTLSHLMTTAIIVGFLTITCFPIWPQFLKIWAWYASVTLLVFMIVFLSARALIWLAMWTAGYEFWILPRLFDESLGFCESFTPVWSLEPGSKGQGYYRSTILVAFVAFVYWAYTQPTDFDSFIAAQKDFVSDLYEGNLLSDVSQDAKENIDKPKVQSLEDILRELDEEEAETDSDGLIDSLLDDVLEGEDGEEDDDDSADADADEPGARSGEVKADE
eukprot:TRINITY_DN3159_c0_g1_i1.p1 TRINITY_DN3159_c0_g1~~TRINITY_DN3159_c0_g1_i1.p1  ORF type:complete len:364 (+),score=117.20 TRINITY_DN3159_c0_g1_i1:78-1094(+)